MTTPDPSGNGSREPPDGPTPEPADEPAAHPSGVPAAGAESDQGHAGTGDAFMLAAPEGPDALSDEGAADKPGYPPIPAMPVEPPPTLGDQTAGSSPDETPTAPQPSVAAQPPSRSHLPSSSQAPSSIRFQSTSRPRSGSGPRPPDWSTPDTPTVAPPLGGTPPAQSPPDPPHPPAPPHPPTYGPPPGGPRGRPPLRRRSVALLLGLTAALLVCCCALAVGGVFAWSDGVYDHLLHRGRRTVGLNETARDGDLEFRVAGVRCNVPRVGDQYVSQVAVGQFCLVDLTVRNAGDRPATFDDSLQRAYGSGDRQFGVDQTAGMIVNAAQPLFLAPINPGNEVSAVLVYDIPADAQLARLLLRATTDSRGVLVKV